MRKLGLSFLIGLVWSGISTAQPFKAVLFVSEADLKIMKIDSLKYFEADNNKYHAYYLTKGTLDREIIGDRREVASNTHNGYEYLYDEMGQLKLRTGNAEVDERNYLFIRYYYQNKKMRIATGGTYFISHENRGADFEWIKKYVYDGSGRLMYEQIYFLDEPGDTYGVVWQKLLAGDTGKNHLIARSRILNKIPVEMNHVSGRKKYYLYVNEKLVGFYPAKDYESDDFTSADSIYSKNLVENSASKGFNFFKSRYLKDSAVLQKVIEDSYYPAKEQQLFINNVTAKAFLRALHKENAVYLILELADNYLLFYKLTD